jgi:CO/xanthine dehydrogenase Mo-binding subunit
MTTTTDLTRSATALFAEAETRGEGREKVSGLMRYAADIQRPNALWAAFATSPIAHGRIVRIDTREAKAVDGVRAVLTWEDIGRRHCGIQLFDWPVLCYDRVRFIGDRVAAVAAETREAAERAARLIVVEYEELPAVFSAADALAEDAPILHPDWEAYHFMAFAGKEKPARAHPNLQTRSVAAKGAADLAPLFASAHRVFEHRFSAPRQHAGYIEPTASLVWLDDDGRTHVHAANKSPLRLRDQLAHVAGIPRESVVIESNAVGGDFGGKGLGRDVYPLYFLARAVGRPVRYVPTYAEELQFGSTRHPAEVVLRTAVDRDGRFVAHEARVLYGGGAYGAVKPAPNLLFGIGFGTGPYQIPNARIEILCPYTNVAPSGYVRAPGDVQTFFALEQHVDMIAEALGVDPLAFRLRNVMREGDTSITNEAMRKPAGEAVLRALERELRAAPPPANGRARGISLTCRHTGIGRASLRLTARADGSIEAVTGSADQGSGSHTIIQRVAAATLGVRPDAVRVRRGSTDEAPFDMGVGASRGTHVIGAAARDAAVKLRELMRERDERPLTVDVDYAGMFLSDDDPPDYSFCAYAIEVGVDLATGELRVHDALVVVDVGQIINPIGHQGQIDGGFMNGLGSALMEDVQLDESGRCLTPGLGEYKLPTIADLPPLRTVLVRTDSVHEPYGAKAIGEHVNAGVAPAIANAIARAGAGRVHDLPLTAQRVLEALS